MQDNMNRGATARAGVAYDAGLRAYFQRIYNTMATGLVLTGIVAWLVAASPDLVKLFYGNALMHFVIAFAPLAFLFFGFTPRRIHRMSVAQVAGLFYAFSGVFGISLAYIFLVYSGESIARVFFITAAMFAGTSIYGYTTRKDLSSMGSLLIMGVWGLLIAMIVNMFMQSSTMDFVISGVGVLVYTGLVAWDTQNLKSVYSTSNGAEANGKMAVMGALNLYINFIMLFQFLLRFMGGGRE